MIEKQPTPIPQPTTAETRDRIVGLNRAIKKAEENLGSLEYGTTDPPSDSAQHIDQLLRLGHTHKIFSTWCERWIQDLETKKNTVEQLIAEGHLPSGKLSRTDMLFEAITQELHAPTLPQDQSSTKRKEKTPSAEREFDRLVYIRTTKHGEKERSNDFPEDMDDRDYALMINLVKDQRAETYVSTIQLQKELTVQFGRKDKGPLIHRIARLRKWLGDDPDNPRLIDQIGEKSGTKYRFNAPARLVRKDEKVSINQEAQSVPAIDLGALTVPQDLPPVIAQLSEETPRYYDPIRKILDDNPPMKKILNSYIEAIAEDIKPDERWQVLRIVNHFRGFSGTFTRPFIEKAVQRKILGKEALQRDATLDREEIVRLRYFHEHSEVIDTLLTPNQLRRVVRKVLRDFEEKEHLRKEK